MKGKGLLLIILIGCMISCSPTLPAYEVEFSGNTIEVPVGNFDNSTFNVVIDNSKPYDILLTRESALAYHSLYLRCTFDKQRLDPAPSEIVCPVCASIFNFDGTVKKGPAETELLQFPTELNPDKTLVTINIGVLGY